MVAYILDTLSPYRIGLVSITIFLVDDHTILRDGLRLFLQAQPDLEVIGEAANGHEAIRQVARQCPGVVIMDITMPDLNGIEATRQIRNICPATRVIILSMHGAAKHVLPALQAGASGYLVKGAASSEIVTAIRAVHSGQRYLSQKILEKIPDEYLSPSQIGQAREPLALLSPREQEVLQLVVEGKSSAEIAELLNLSTKTIETYRSRLMRKLNLHDLPSLVKFALHHGLTSLE